MVVKSVKGVISADDAGLYTVVPIIWSGQMGYPSIDAVQKVLTKELFQHTTDAKKAAGRAMGTIIEIVAFHLLKSWNLSSYATIEHRLVEFGNPSITHNVEFALHPKLEEYNLDVSTIKHPITTAKIIRSDATVEQALQDFERRSKQLTSLVDGQISVTNCCTLGVSTERNLVAVANYESDDDGKTGSVRLSILGRRPFSIVECKRVGVEEGAGKGPTTIEKAKQGAYVATHASSLQKIRKKDGTTYGVLPKGDRFEIAPYDVALDNLIRTSDTTKLSDFVLTVGVASNHGNWFTSNDPNKELLVLQQSYDWLLFLEDKGLVEFIQHLLAEPDRDESPARNAFEKSYEREKGQKKGKNVFTKVNMSLSARNQIDTYFSIHKKEIEQDWFTVFSTTSSRIAELKGQLNLLATKEWFKK